MYRKEPGGKKQSDTLLPLDALYEMLISHSQFLDVILSDGLSGNNDAKGVFTVLASDSINVLKLLAAH